MSCESCGTIERYGKRIVDGKRLCIDCWKLKEKKDNEKSDESSKE